MWALIRGAASARWFLPVLIGVPLAATAVFGYGYMRGSATASAAALIEKNEALAAQRDRLLAQGQKERRVALDAQRKRFQAAGRIGNVARPRDGCHLSAECLRYHDDVIRAAQGLE